MMTFIVKTITATLFGTGSRRNPARPNRRLMFEAWLGSLEARLSPTAISTIQMTIKDRPVSATPRTLILSAVAKGKGNDPNVRPIDGI